MTIPSKLPDAAVLIIISGQPGSEKVLLTKRAMTLRLHAGEVAFPGGKQEEDDNDLYQTALRECYEEVGIANDSLTLEAELPPHFTRRGSAVAPFVASLTRRVNLSLNEDEIQEAFWAPVSLFTEDKRSKTHIFKASQREYWAPVYHFENYEIWGFTARVLVSLANLYYGKSLTREHPSAPELIYR